MKRRGFVIRAGILFASTVVAQTPSGALAGAPAAGEGSARAGQTQAQATSSEAGSSSTAAENGQINASLATGSTINAVLTAPIDSKKTKPGDRVEARTTEAAKSGGKTVIPRGAKLMGHVTQASARSKGDSDSTLGMVFDKAILKNGQEVPLNVAVQALASAQSASAINGGDEIPAMGGAGASMAGSGRAAGSGALGGVTSTAGAAAGSATNTAANTRSTAGGALNSSAVGGLNAAGQLSSDSRGVFGLQGVGLTAATTGSGVATVISSTGKNVRLDSGTQLLLVAEATNTAPRP